MEDCPNTEFIVSGAGAKQRPLSSLQANSSFYQAGEVSGFFWIEIIGDTFYGAAYEVDTDGTPELVFERSFVRRGALAAQED
ncbi:hypothetical protein CAI21_08600 [Alkalilimnicola ehrlichii]|uniref:hypothetical protein n=1 Tax=Alkalilimnicola ehrlichii TaxID=351052 RepID=UPI000E2EFA5B|nr:hypothetical protein [Alkalilimnicola ehrlichii]RFA29883.1 hypothetical protein CAI21_08600 [Alkalilimnicola ehrlichii]